MTKKQKSDFIFKGRVVKPRTENQQEYVDALQDGTFIFCSGPAGSGKTHISVGKACEELQNKRFEQIILTRPIIEAGNERLGALPGTTEEKMHPFLRPLYDEMGYFVSETGMIQLKTAGMLEICPLAHMRGRTFKNSFVIIDEAQNATDEQLLMLLTRLGIRSKLVLVGDPDQSDLHPKIQGSLSDLMEDLEGIDGIEMVYLETVDIVRHPLVAKIVERLKIKRKFIYGSSPKGYCSS